jgi:hypothetical protein
MASGTRWTGGWVSPRVCQDAVEWRKIFFFLPGSNRSREARELPRLRLKQQVPLKHWCLSDLTLNSSRLASIRDALSSNLDQNTAYPD